MTIFRLTTQRNFGLVWWSGLISMLGDWMLSVALPIAVYTITESAAAVSTIVVARLIPSFLLGSFAGVFVDRWDRRQVMIISNVIRAPVVACLIFVNSPGDIWIVQVVAFVGSSASQFFRPAENALIPELVENANLTSANSLNALNNNLASVLGPGLGGLVATLGGLSAVAILDAASFLIAALLLFFVRVDKVPKHSREPSVPLTVSSFFAEWRDGLRQIPQNQMLRVLFLVALLLAAGNVAFTTLLGPFVVDILRGGDKELGWLLTAQGIGGIVGGILLGMFGHLRPPFFLLGWSVGLLGLLDLILYVHPLFVAGVWFAVGIKVVMGVPIAMTNASSATLLQQETAVQYRGRVFSALDATMSIVAIIAALIAGLAADKVGLVPVLVALASLTLLAGIVMIRLQSTLSLEPASFATRRVNPDPIGRRS